MPSPAPSTLPDTANLEFLTALSGQARGVAITTIKAPPGRTGLPEEIPVAIRHGTNPEISGVERLFADWRVRPERKKGTARALTLRSFIALVDHHKRPETRIFADTDFRKPSLTAVIDYHEGGDGKADNNSHRIHYTFPLSEEWQRWVKANGEPMTQGDFALFLEDNIADLSAPNDHERLELERDFATRIATPSALIQISRGLQVNVDAVIKNAQTLQSGEISVSFEETHKGADGKPLQVPGLFLLCVAPFFLGEKVRIPVRLRYRVRDGKLVWAFQMHRHDAHVTERIRNDLDEAVQKTGVTGFEGAPES